MNLPIGIKIKKVETASGTRVEVHKNYGLESSTPSCIGVGSTEHAAIMDAKVRGLWPEIKKPVTNPLTIKELKAAIAASERAGLSDDCFVAIGARTPTGTHLIDVVGVSMPVVIRDPADAETAWRLDQVEKTCSVVFYRLP